MFCPRLVSLILLTKTSLNSAPKCRFNHSFIYGPDWQRLPVWVSTALLVYHIHRNISKNMTLCHATSFYSKHLALLECTPLLQPYSAALGTVGKLKAGKFTLRAEVKPRVSTTSEQWTCARRDGRAHTRCLPPCLSKCQQVCHLLSSYLFVLHNPLPPAAVCGSVLRAEATSFISACRRCSTRGWAVSRARGHATAQLRKS